MIRFISARLAHVTSFVTAEHTVAPPGSQMVLKRIYMRGDERYIVNFEARPLYPRVRGYVHLTRIGLVLAAAALWITLVAPSFPLGAVLVVIGGHAASLVWNLKQFGPGTAFPKLLRTLPQLAVVGVPIVGVMLGRGYGWLALLAWLVLYVLTLYQQD